MTPMSMASQADAAVRVSETQESLWRQAHRQARLYDRVIATLEHHRHLETDPVAAQADRDERLARMLLHATTSVPHYRALGLSPLDAAELSNFPLVRRADLRDGLIDFLDDDFDPADCQYAPTSGTSGVPIRVIYDSEFLVNSYASALREKLDLGLGMHPRILMPMVPWVDGWFEYAAPAQTLGGMAALGAGRSDGDAGTSELMKAVEFNPDILFGHPSHLLAFARVLDAAGIVAPRPRVAMTFGESLAAADRERIGRAFGASVRDGYGMREVGTIAAECSAGVLHVAHERLVVEILDSSGRSVGTGVSGEIVVTTLTNQTMPLVRYATNDTGALSSEPCECGATSPILALLEGRKSGSFRVADRTVDLIPVAHRIRDTGAERFQTIVHGPDEVEIRLSSPEPIAPDLLERLTSRIGELTGPTVRVTVRQVRDEDFHLTLAGKLVDFVDLTAVPR